MTKHTTLGLAIALALTALTLGGCELYLGEKDNGESWTYCTDDGFFICNGNDCEFAGPTCPEGAPGSACESDIDCASGCFCGPNGRCEEAGFCDPTKNGADCPDGFHCDGRSSCVPDECSAEKPCEGGDVCNNGVCEPNPATCAGAADPTCMVAAPTCPTGSTAVLLDGCFTGACQAIDTCDAAPVCAHLSGQQHESDCLARSTDENGPEPGGEPDCSMVYAGSDCRKPDGTQCRVGDTDCVCRVLSFNACVERTDGNARIGVEAGHTFGLR